MPKNGDQPFPLIRACFKNPLRSEPGLKSVCENLSSLKGLGCFSYFTQHSACGSVLG